MSFLPISSTDTNMNRWIENYEASALYVVKPWIYGNIFSGIIYGAIAFLYATYTQLIRRQYPKFDLFTRQAWILLGYMTVTFLLCTLTIASALQKTLVLIDLPVNKWRDPEVQIQGGAGIIGNVCFMLTSWMADALLIWRCLVIYHDLGLFKWLVVSVSLVLQAGSIVFGSFFCHKLSFDPNDVFLPMIYYEIITLAQNLILTVSITSRLFVLRHRVRKALGSDFGYEYTNVAAMMTESQAMTLVAQIVMLVLIVKVGDSGGNLVIYQILAQVQALAPMLIIYRVVQGKAWSNNTFAQITKSHSFEIPK